jgi:uncharacterized membrane protein
MTAKQNAFKTNGEDLGLMDQALWSLLHGSFFHQTICNVLTDTNCSGLNGYDPSTSFYVDGCTSISSWL